MMMMILNLKVSEELRRSARSLSHQQTSPGCRSLCPGEVHLVHIPDFQRWSKREFVNCAQDFCEELEYWGLDDLHMVGSLFTIIVTIIMVIGIIVIVTWLPQWQRPVSANGVASKNAESWLLGRSCNWWLDATIGPTPNGIKLQSPAIARLSSKLEGQIGKRDHFVRIVITFHQRHIFCEHIASVGQK